MYLFSSYIENENELLDRTQGANTINIHSCGLNAFSFQFNFAYKKYIYFISFVLI